MEYTIVEGGIPVGFFPRKEDRDAAFENYFQKSNRYGFKGDTK